MDELSKPIPVEATQPAEEVEADFTGQVLGDFRILRRLGQGGMGQVYLAEQVSLKRKVALKLLKPELAASPVTLQRFKQEAEAVARTTHANIVQIYFIGTTAGHNYMALEYVEGKNLREFLEKKGPPDVLLGLRIMAQIASALQRASELGVIHRDIKPENILLTRKGEVKVADFGLSRCFAETGPGPSLTQSGITMGTPLYMSPEQVESKPIDHRTDIYSFGVTCFHMFAGHPPFRGQTPLEVAYQHVHKDPPELAVIRPDLPVDLCAMIHKMMVKDPAARYQTGSEVARDISRLRYMLVAGGAGAAGSQPLVGLSSEGLRGSSTQLLPLAGQHGRWQRGLIAAGLAAALVGGLVFGWAHAHRQSADMPAAATPPNPEDAAAVKAMFSAKEREKELQHLVQEHLKPESRLSTIAGLNHSIDLGLFYLNERRLDDAEQFFTKIALQGKKMAAYRLLSQVGHAAVLAFKDEPAESNKQFQAVVDQMEKCEKITGGKPGIAAIRKELNANAELIQAYVLLWKDDPRLRELVARALVYNQQNDATHFPPHLERYCHPPRPRLNAPPAGPG